MHSQSLLILQKELDYYEDLIRQHPVRFQEDPFIMNTIVQLVLRHPDIGVNGILDWFQTKYKIQVKLNIRAFLVKYYLLKSDGRLACNHYVELARKNLTSLLYDDPAAAKSGYISMKDIRLHTRHSWPAVTRVALINFVNDLEISADPEERKVAQGINRLLQGAMFHLTSKFFNSIVGRVADARGLIGAETVTDQISGIIEEVSQFDQSAEDNEIQLTDIETLQEENSDLRAALFGLKHELTDLQKRIRIQQEAAQTQALVRFLSEMNSPSSGHLLDNIIHSGNTINELLSSNWQPESPEVEGIVYSLKMLTDFLIRTGISPIKEIGSYEQITMKDLPGFSYIGSEFHDPDEVKSVQFRSPGWEYKDQIISRPQAIEVLPDKGIKSEGKHARRR